MCASRVGKMAVQCIIAMSIYHVPVLDMYVSVASPDPIIAGALSLTVPSQQYKHLTHAMDKSQSIYYLKLYGEAL